MGEVKKMTDAQVRDRKLIKLAECVKFLMNRWIETPTKVLFRTDEENRTVETATKLSENLDNIIEGKEIK